MRQRKPKVTIQTLADQLGVSKFSVSRALSGKTGVSDATRAEVLAVARQMGYPLRESPDEAAPGEGAVFALLIAREPAQETSFWPHVLIGIQEEVKAQGGSLVIAVVSPDEQQDGVLPATLSHLRPAGVICIGLDADYVAAITTQGYEVVLVDMEHRVLDSVLADNYGGARDAMAHLLAMGHRAIGFVGDNHGCAPFFQRWLGYREAMEEAGLPIRPEWLLDARGTAPWNLAFLQGRIRALETFPTAWLCANDATALQLIRVLAEFRQSVPADLSVIGFDDIPEAARSLPPLTTVRIDKEAMGRWAVRRMCYRLKHPDEPNNATYIRTRLVLRESVRSLETAP
ncbi:MAG: LacI family DNA-binding transcriptional regulator [Mycobacterium leprae]